MTVQIQVRRGTASEWTTSNPILASGEIGFETDTLKGKIGNGSSVWSSLSYTFLSGSMSNPMTTVGDTLYGATSGTATRLAGNTTTTPNFLTSTGTGSAAQAPTYTSSTGTGTVVLNTSPIFSGLPSMPNIDLGFTTTITSASAVTLTASSNNQQYFTGSTAQTVVLPVTSTLSTGVRYRIVNNSSATLTVNSSGGNLVTTVLAGQGITITCIGTTLTTAADWDIDATYVAVGNITGLGTGVATALAINTGSAGAPVLFNGALGTPTSGTLTNATGLPISGLTASTATALGVGSIELGHATDTTIARVSAGVISVEGVTVPTISSTDSLTNKKITLSAGTATAGTAPLKFTSGTNLTNTEAGTIEYTGDLITVTNSGTATGRAAITNTYWVYSNTNSGAATTTTPVAIFQTGARALTLEAAKTYYFKILMHATATFTSGTAAIQFAPTFTNAPVAINYVSKWIPSTAGNSLSTRQTATTAASVSPSITATISGVIEIEGSFQSNATTGGTITMNFQMSAAGSSTVINSGAYQQVMKIGTGAPATISGTWA